MAKKSPKKGSQATAPSLMEQYRGGAPPPLEGTRKYQEETGEKPEKKDVVQKWFNQAKEVGGQGEGFLGVPSTVLDPKEHAHSLIDKNKKKKK